MAVSSILLLVLPIAVLAATLPHRRVFWTLTAVAPVLIAPAGFQGITAAVALGFVLLAVQAHGQRLAARWSAARPLHDPELPRRLEALLARTLVPRPDVRVAPRPFLRRPVAAFRKPANPEDRYVRLLLGVSPPRVLLDPRFVRGATPDEITGLLALQLARLEAAGPPSTRRLLERGAVVVGLSGAVLAAPDLTAPFLALWGGAFLAIHALYVPRRQPGEDVQAAALCGDTGPVVAALERAHRVTSDDALPPERLERLQSEAGQVRPLVPLFLGAAAASAITLEAEGVRWGRPEAALGEDPANVFVPYHAISRLGLRAGAPPVLEVRLASGGEHTVPISREDANRAGGVIKRLPGRLARRSHRSPGLARIGVAAVAILAAALGQWLLLAPAAAALLWTRGYATPLLAGAALAAGGAAPLLLLEGSRAVDPRFGTGIGLAGLGLALAWLACRREHPERSDLPPVLLALAPGLVVALTDLDTFQSLGAAGLLAGVGFAALLGVLPTRAARLGWLALATVPVLLGAWSPADDLRGWGAPHRAVLARAEPEWAASIAGLQRATAMRLAEDGELVVLRLPAAPGRSDALNPDARRFAVIGRPGRITEITAWDVVPLQGRRLAILDARGLRVVRFGILPEAPALGRPDWQARTWHLGDARIVVAADELSVVGLSSPELVRLSGHIGAEALRPETWRGSFHQRFFGNEGLRRPRPSGLGPADDLPLAVAGQSALLHPLDPSPAGGPDVLWGLRGKGWSPLLETALPYACFDGRPGRGVPCVSSDGRRTFVWRVVTEIGKRRLVTVLDQRTDRVVADAEGQVALLRAGEPLILADLGRPVRKVRLPEADDLAIAGDRVVVREGGSIRIFQIR